MIFKYLNVIKKNNKKVYEKLKEAYAKAVLEDYNYGSHKHNKLTEDIRFLACFISENSNVIKKTSTNTDNIPPAAKKQISQNQFNKAMSTADQNNRTIKTLVSAGNELSSSSDKNAPDALIKVSDAIMSYDS